MRRLARLRAARDGGRHRGPSRRHAQQLPILRAALLSRASPRSALRRARRGHQQGALVDAAVGWSAGVRGRAAPVRRHGLSRGAAAARADGVAGREADSAGLSRRAVRGDQREHGGGPVRARRRAAARHLLRRRHRALHAGAGAARGRAAVRVPRPAQAVQGRGHRDSRLRRAGRSRGDAGDRRHGRLSARARAARGLA